MLPGLHKPAAAMQNWWCGCSSIQCIHIVWTLPHSLWYSTTHQPLVQLDTNSTYLQIYIHKGMLRMKTFSYRKVLQHVSHFLDETGKIMVAIQRNLRPPNCPCFFRMLIGTYVTSKSQKAHTGSYTVPVGFCRKYRIYIKYNEELQDFTYCNFKFFSNLYSVLELEANCHAHWLVISQHCGGYDRRAQDSAQIPVNR